MHAKRLRTKKKHKITDAPKAKTYIWQSIYTRGDCEHMTHTPPNPKYWQNPQNQGWSFRTTDRGSQRSGTPAHTWTAPLLSPTGAGSRSSLTFHLTLHLQIHLRISWCISTELRLLLPAGACWWTFFVVIHVTSKHCLSSVEEKETNGLNLEFARLPFFKVMADALSVSNWKVFSHLLNLAKCF